MADYIPGTDEKFVEWTEQFTEVVKLCAEDLEISDEDVAEVVSAREAFIEAYEEHHRAQEAARAATVRKDEQRHEMRQAVRKMAQQLRYAPKVTEKVLEAAGLPVHGGHCAAPEMDSEKPNLLLESVPGRVTVHVGPRPENERMNGKPSCAKAIYIFRKKKSDKDWELREVVTRSPFVDTVEGPAADYVYMARYKATKGGALGEESEHAVIAAGGLMAA